jgi:hypothetical protein
LNETFLRERGKNLMDLSKTLQLKGAALAQRKSVRKHMKDKKGLGFIPSPEKLKKRHFIHNRRNELPKMNLTILHFCLIEAQTFRHFYRLLN